MCVWEDKRACEITIYERTGGRVRIRRCVREEEEEEEEEEEDVCENTRNRGCEGEHEDV